MTEFAAVKAIKVAATGDVTTYPCRVRGVLLSGVTATAGDLVLRDNDASGTILATINVPSGTFCVYMDLSGSYYRAITKLHCSVIPAGLIATVNVDPPT